jgi:hypothetical protein
MRKFSAYANTKILGLAGLPALAFMMATSGPAFAASGQDTFTVTTTLATGLQVDCGNSLSFGQITRGAGYAGTGTVTIPAASGGAASTTDPQLILDGNGIALTCAVSGLANPGAATVASYVLSGGGAATPGSTLTGVVLTGADGVQTLSANLTSAYASGGTDSGAGTVYVGGTLTMKPAGAAANQAKAQTYTSTAVTLTVTE